MNSQQASGLNRRAFTALAGAVATYAAQASIGCDRHAQFVRDLARSYECQHVAVDMDAVRAVFDAMHAPRLGMGTCAGPDGSALAAWAALREVGAVRGMHAAVVIACPPGEERLATYRLAMNTLRQGLHADTMIVYGGCGDSRLANGLVRVSLLVG